MNANSEQADPLPNPPPDIPGEGIKPRRYRFAKSQRLHGRGTFKAILDAGHRKWNGPIAMCIAPSASPTCNLGISIGRPVGTAAVRNQIKRKLREAFRLMQHDWPRAYDVVLLVKKHEPLTLAEYQRLMTGLMVRCLKPREPS
ncbi:MAG: ribonuclease P protein component [Tepidisphaeraceae bacterium]